MPQCDLCYANWTTANALACSHRLCNQCKQKGYASETMCVACRTHLNIGEAAHGWMPEAPPPYDERDLSRSYAQPQTQPQPQTPQRQLEDANEVTIRSTSMLASMWETGHAIMTAKNHPPHFRQWAESSFKAWEAYLTRREGESMKKETLFRTLMNMFQQDMVQSLRASDWRQIPPEFVAMQREVARAALA